MFCRKSDDELHNMILQGDETGSNEAYDTCPSDRDDICPLMIDQNQYQPGRGLCDEEYLWRQHKGFIPAYGAKRRCCLALYEMIQGAFFSLFPFFGVMRKYDIRRDLLADVIAGLTIGIMHIPQGMAYGQLANLPPVYGLYVALFPPLVYFFLGTSRHLSLGTFAVVSLMVGNVVAKAGCDVVVTPRSDDTVHGLHPRLAYINGTMATNHTDSVLTCKLVVATAVTMVAGIYQMLMGVLRLGVVTRMLTDPLTRGFITGAAARVFTTQVGHVFDLHLRDEGPTPLALLNNYFDLFSNICSANIVASLMSCSAMLMIYITKTYLNVKTKGMMRMPIPIELITVVLGTAVSYLGKLETRFSLSVVGAIPAGLPVPHAPSLQEFPRVLVDAAGIAIVAYVVSLSMGKLFAKQHDYTIDPNQELIALGASNVVGSCFSCFASAASLSRSVVQEELGGKTQVVSVISCSLILVVLFAIGPLFSALPNNVLAAIIIVNLKGLFLQITDLKKYWAERKIDDFFVWIVVCGATILLDVKVGLLVGVLFNAIVIAGEKCRCRGKSEDSISPDTAGHKQRNSNGDC